MKFRNRNRNQLHILCVNYTKFWTNQYDIEPLCSRFVEIVTLSSFHYILILIVMIFNVTTNNVEQKSNI